MPKPTKNKHQSKYTDRPITDAQRIAELFCENAALKSNEELPWKFWNVEKWRTPFREQLYAANELLKLWAPRVIFKALSYPEARKITGGHWEASLDPLLRKAKAELDRQDARLVEYQEERRGSVSERPRPQFGTKNKRLKDLD